MDRWKMGEAYDIRPWARISGLQVPPKRSEEDLECAELNLSITSINTYCVSKFAMACWGIWCSRNDYVWRNAVYSMDSMLRSAMSLLSSWKDVNEPEAPVSTHTAEELWCPPSHGCLKLNTDVAMESNSGIMGMGWIIRDEMGVLVAAKAMSIHEALSLVKSLGYGDIDVETDSQIVFYALSTISYNSPFSFSLLIDDVKEAASQIHVDVHIHSTSH
ncbi:PREDICTED: uncharacterized protein LOC109154880 [Ipomoea nil]|uniref:uncharacterized protein LOC109154880 n=1 Tax=Ipomoea nil TaxID=35883 RepID=UPI00090195F6|nr:PREDICTED: uncharacterized protein LOC109154880 [Ipomoea nil]